MRAPAPQRRDGSDETLFMIIVGIAATAAVGHWLVGNLAALIGRGRLLRAGLGDALTALTRIPSHADDPRQAWDPPTASNLPGPVVYWLSVAVVMGALLGLAIVIVNRREGRRHDRLTSAAGSASRRRPDSPPPRISDPC